MNVEQLIEELMKLPKDKTVFVYDGVYPIGIQSVYIDDDGDVAIQV